MTPIRICICWTDISGYMAACWRALKSLPRFDVKIIAFTPEDSKEAVFDREIVEGLDIQLIDRRRTFTHPEEVGQIVKAFAPDVVTVPGWLYPGYRNLPRLLPAARFIMSMDNPWTGSLRQYLGRFAHRRFFSQIDRVMVAGERTFQFALALGFEEFKIRRGTYGFDVDRFSSLHSKRTANGPWPREFLFIGQYAQKKNLPLLLEAYAQYRRTAAAPWGLTCMGMGPLASLLAGCEGVKDLGFVQPAKQAQVLERVGAFVLPSRYDPWGVAIAEACAAGLPIVCSEACGASLELVRSYYNGITVATNHKGALVRALTEIDTRFEELPAWGTRSMALSGAFGAPAWAQRWGALFDELSSNNA